MHNVLLFNDSWWDRVHATKKNPLENSFLRHHIIIVLVRATIIINIVKGTMSHGCLSSHHRPLPLLFPPLPYPLVLCPSPLPFPPSSPPVPLPPPLPPPITALTPPPSSSSPSSSSFFSSSFSTFRNTSSPYSFPIFVFPLLDFLLLLLLLCLSFVVHLG